MLYLKLDVQSISVLYLLVVFKNIKRTRFTFYHIRNTTNVVFLTECHELENRPNCMR